MIKQHQKKLNIINQLIDVIIFFLSYLFASFLRFGVGKGELSLAESWNGKYLLFALIYSLLIVFVFYLMNVYRPGRKRHLFEEIFEISWISLMGIILVSSGMYFIKASVFSRLTIGLFYLISTCLLSVKRCALKYFLHTYRKKGYNQKHIIVIGNGHLAKKYIHSVQMQKELGYVIDGYVSKIEKPELGKSLGSYEEIYSILENPNIDEVVVALEPHETYFMKSIIEATEKQGVKISIIPFYNDYIPAHPSVEEVGDCKLFNIRTIPLDYPMNAFLKRCLDIFASLFLILITSPIMLVAVIGIKVTGGKGPVIFKQERVGLNKKIFTMYKFRSMRVNDESNTAWSTNNDSRKTFFGSVLRKFSIDELPQFFNVLKGDMSIIGPRPEVPFYVNQFKEEIPKYMIRHQVRPGITGWAQVNGYRGDTSIEKRIEHDIWYIEHWSLFLDIKIVFMTIFGGLVNKETIGGGK